ncbi:MAG: hypothetical protein OHK0021_02220 [Bryobacter sp.]
MMKRRGALKALSTIPVLPKLWSAENTRAWLGPEYWANPLQDWRKRGEVNQPGGGMECFVAGGDRNVYWLTKEIRPGNFTMSVKLLALAGNEGWVGFRVGMRGHFDDYRDTAVRGLGLECGLKADGTLFVGPGQDGTKAELKFPLELKLESRGGVFRLSAGNAAIEVPMPEQYSRGGIALVCHSGEFVQKWPVWNEPGGANAGKPNQARGGTMLATFADWKLEGEAVQNFPERAWGPILFAQHTLSRGVLKLTAQFAPLEGDEGEAELWVEGKRVAAVKPEVFSSTAAFRVPGWDATKAHSYEVRLGSAKFTGTIRPDPQSKPQLVVGSLTCQGDFGFPHTPIAKNLKALQPDVLFFTGDQIYEANAGYGVQRGPLPAARLDYLRKWYLFGWAWGGLTRDIPTVCLPDDHDVYHGNLWGASGRRAEGNEGQPGYPIDMVQQDSGGYKMPANWVNMVQRTQSSHLPDAADPALVEQDITVHFGHLVYGGVSFALLEDRKFKSAPKLLMPEAKIRNGWPQNPQWNAAKQGDVPGAQLLGERQEKFLTAWARDWEGVEMKAVVSATIFCNLCTLPKEAMSDNVTSKLAVLRSDKYAPNEKLTMDHDSNAWPQTARNRALRLLRAGVAVHLAGDQHLGSTLQYGVDAHEDASFALCSPAISNIFPRRWFPPNAGRNPDKIKSVPLHNAQVGDFEDGFGNRITVHAVANPHLYDVRPRALNNRAPGFGVVVFDKAKRTIALTNWPRWVDVTQPSAKPFQGWPITIRDEDNGLNGAGYEIALRDSAEGVVEVVEEATGELAYAWRLPEKRKVLRVWKPGRYTVSVKAAGKQRTWRGLVAKPIAKA